MIKVFRLSDPMALLGKLIDCPCCGRVLKVIHVDPTVKRALDRYTGQEGSYVDITLSDHGTARFFLEEVREESDPRAKKIEHGMNGGWVDG